MLLFIEKDIDGAALAILHEDFVEFSHLVQAETQRLPDPCPLPNSFSRITHQAIEQGQLSGNMKTRLLREAVMFYFGICSGGSSTEYITIATMHVC